MRRMRVKSYKYRIGKNNYIVVRIYQSAHASAQSGNVMASNAASVQIYKSSKPSSRAKRRR